MVKFDLAADFVSGPIDLSVEGVSCPSHCQVEWIEVEAVLLPWSPAWLPAP